MFLILSTVELEPGWSIGASKLNKIIISPNNPKYSFYDDKMIIGKSTLESPNFDVLVYCIKSAKTIEIPSFIKTIGPYAFYECDDLQQIEIPTNSELEAIEKYAFSYTSIESFTIPSKLIRLNDKWCHETSKLNKIIISPNNPRYSFYDNKIIIGKSSLESKNFDVLVFCIRNIKTIEIPSFIKTIGPYSFNGCKNLQQIEIPTNSELEAIEKRAFLHSSIEKFTIPPHLTKICKGAFSCCDNFLKIEIQGNSELKTIEDYAFTNSSIESLQIPTSTIELDYKWCIGISK